MRTIVLAAVVSLSACASSPPPPSSAPPAVVASPPPAAVVAPAPPAPPPGTTKEAAIEVCMPRGQRAYLARLRCPEGEAPRFHRRGSVGPRHRVTGESSGTDVRKQLDVYRQLAPGEIDHHIVDVYEVACPTQTHSIYLDMYHCGQPPPAIAPPGFTVAMP